jgi:crotonobetainyl-CoA:carnitine CoA-transferase CaiB-like acyl-CoA transferase
MIARVGNGSFAAPPIRLASREPWPEEPAPELGQHTDEVLAEIGYNDDEISRLRGLGVVS